MHRVPGCRRGWGSKPPRAEDQPGGHAPLAKLLDRCDSADVRKRLTNPAQQARAGTIPASTERDGTLDARVRSAFDKCETMAARSH